MDDVLPGRSSGDGIKEIERLAAQLPPGIGYEWTGLSYQEKAAGSQAPMLLALALLVVFLVLVALYESWKILFSVLLIVPIGTGVLGGMLTATLLGVLFVPVFYVWVMSRFNQKKTDNHQELPVAIEGEAK